MSLFNNTERKVQPDVVMDSNADTIRKKALRLLLRPIVRYCLHSSQTIQDFIDAAKLVFVEMAVDEMRRSTDKVNVSRLSVMTGIHRKDVTAIYRDETEPIRQAPSLLSRVIGLWGQGEQFTTKDHQPRVLSYEGDQSEFRDLVEQVSKNINPATVLFELERIGAVEKSARGVRLVRQIDRLRGDPLKKYELLSRDIDSLMTGVGENIAADDSKNLHIRTEYDNIYQKDLPQIKEWLLQEGRAFHKRARDFLSQFDKDISADGKGRAGARVVLGAFSLTTEGEDVKNDN